MDSDTKEVIRRLQDRSLSDADISSCISILEMLLFLEGLQPLLNVLKSKHYSIVLRQQAAKAISVIGSKYVADELEALGRSGDPELVALAKVALEGS